MMRMGMKLEKSGWFLIGFLCFYIVVLVIWFLYSWVYSQPGGWGLYLIPEKEAFVVAIGIIGFGIYLYLRMKK